MIVDPERQDGSGKREECGQAPLLESGVTPTRAVLGVPCVRRHPPKFRANVAWDPQLTCQRLGNESTYRGTAVGARSHRGESWQCWRSVAARPFSRERHFQNKTLERDSCRVRPVTQQDATAAPWPARGRPSSEARVGHPGSPVTQAASGEGGLRTQVSSQPSALHVTIVVFLYTYTAAFSCHGGRRSHVAFADLEAAGGNKLPQGAWLEGDLAGGHGGEAETGIRSWGCSWGQSKLSLN